MYVRSYISIYWCYITSRNTLESGIQLQKKKLLVTEFGLLIFPFSETSRMSFIDSDIRVFLEAGVYTLVLAAVLGLGCALQYFNIKKLDDTLRLWSSRKITDKTRVKGGQVKADQDLSPDGK